MDSEKFVYWLQGFVELSDTNTISEKQWLIIKDHLKLVFDKKTPSRSESPDRSDVEIRTNMPTWPPKEGLPTISDLIGKNVDPSYWQYPYKPVITCSVSDNTKINDLMNSAIC